MHAAVGPAAEARSGALAAGEHLVPGQGRVGSGAPEGAAPVAPELGKSQPFACC